MFCITLIFVSHNLENEGVKIFFCGNQMLKKKKFQCHATMNSDRQISNAKKQQPTDKNETLLDLCGVYNTKIKGSLHIQLQTNVICMSNMITCTIFHTWLVCVFSVHRHYTQSNCCTAR